MVAPIELRLAPAAKCNSAFGTLESGDSSVRFRGITSYVNSTSVYVNIAPATPQCKKDFLHTRNPQSSFIPAMPPTPLSTVEAILATADIHPEFAAALEKIPIPPGSSWTLESLKDISSYTLPYLQKRIAESRPKDISESEHCITLRDGYRSRLLVCRKSNLSNQPCPIIVLFHGGGHTVGSPETEIPLARRLVQSHNAIVVCPCYRLAPEEPFPASTNDSWDTLRWVAAESQNAQSVILPNADAAAGFIVGGASAGANLAASLAHLARDNDLTPPLTGQFLSAGTFISPYHVPEKYAPSFLSREQNEMAPLLDKDLYAIFQDAFKPDFKSPLWAIFDQHDPRDARGEVKMGHMDLPPAYFQVCGMDISRDDSLIYEKVLREECKIATRTDLYEGFGHCWWNMFTEIKMSQKRMVDSVEGVGWLLDLTKKGL